ncbi:MAG: type II toxin-antitoxin system RelE/ParE family toxin [Candidatus Brocadiia bacterium]
MDIRFLTTAQRELDDAIEYYSAESPGLGERFLLEILNTLDLIRQYPAAWPSYTDNTRRCQTRRFPYGVVYQVLDSEILVVAVAHLHRAPGYWTDRL